MNSGHRIDPRRTHDVIAVLHKMGYCHVSTTVSYVQMMDGWQWYHPEVVEYADESRRNNFGAPRAVVVYWSAAPSHLYVQDCNRGVNRLFFDSDASGIILASLSHLFCDDTPTHNITPRKASVPAMQYSMFDE